MSEWYDIQKKPSGDSRKLLQERLDKANPPEFDSLKTKRPVFRQIRTCLLGCRPVFGKNRVLARL